MRVTQQQLSQMALRSVMDARERLQTRQEVAATGRRVDVPSDDPSGATQARLLNNLLEETDSHSKNIDFGKLRLERAEQGLAEGGNILVRAKELALQMANGTMSSEQRNLAADEIDELRKSLMDLANTKQGDEYIFASVAMTSPPVDASGTFTYDVDLYNSVRQVEIGPTSRGEISASGARAFGQLASNPASVDTFAVLADLATALRSNDADAIRGEIDNVEAAHRQIVAERTQVGIRSNRLVNAATSIDQAASLYKSLEADIVDADAAEAFSQLSLAQSNLQAAIAVSSKMLGPSLLDTM